MTHQHRISGNLDLEVPLEVYDNRLGITYTQPWPVDDVSYGGSVTTEDGWFDHRVGCGEPGRTDIDVRWIEFKTTEADIEREMEEVDLHVSLACDLAYEVRTALEKYLDNQDPMEYLCGD